MKVQILIIEDDETPGEKNICGHGMEFEMPNTPQAGDLVTVSHPDQEGETWLVVRRIIWVLDHPGGTTAHRIGEHPIGAVSKAILECEFAVGPYQSEEHKDR